MLASAIRGDHAEKTGRSRRESGAMLYGLIIVLVCISVSHRIQRRYIVDPAVLVTGW
jgi:hypothetical protein